MTEQVEGTEQTEQITTAAIQPSYDEIRDTVPNSAIRESWRGADRRTGHLREVLREVDQDESLSPEGKAERAQRLIDKESPLILGAYESCRKKAADSSQVHYEFSIPMPNGNNYRTTSAKDSNERIVVRLDSENLVKRAEQARDQATMRDRSKQGGNRGIKPASDARLEVIREAYGEAMRTGGDEGRLSALAAIRAADELGYETDRIVDEHRTDIHRRALEDSGRLQRASNVIPNGERAVVNPFVRETRRDIRRVVTPESETRARASLLSPAGIPKKKPRPSWK